MKILLKVDPVTFNLKQKKYMVLIVRNALAYLLKSLLVIGVKGFKKKGWGGGRERPT